MHRRQNEGQCDAEWKCFLHEVEELQSSRTSFRVTATVDTLEKWRHIFHVEHQNCVRGHADSHFQQHRMHVPVPGIVHADEIPRTANVESQSQHASPIAKQTCQHSSA